MPGLRLLADAAVSCPVGFMPPDCLSLCTSGFYGINCVSRCPATCLDNICKADTGNCIQCQPGFTDPKCSSKCPSGFFGQNCKETCSLNCLNNLCDAFTGFCEECIPKYEGGLCDKLSFMGKENGSDNSKTNDAAANQLKQTSSRENIIIYAIVVLLVCIVPGFVFYFCVSISARESRTATIDQTEPHQHSISSISSNYNPTQLSKSHQQMQTIKEESGTFEALDSADQRVPTPKDTAVASGLKSLFGIGTSKSLMSRTTKHGSTIRFKEIHSVKTDDNGRHTSAENKSWSKTPVEEQYEATRGLSNSLRITPSGQGIRFENERKNTFAMKDLGRGGDHQNMDNGTRYFWHKRLDMDENLDSRNLVNNISPCAGHVEPKSRVIRGAWRSSIQTPWQGLTARHTTNRTHYEMIPLEAVHRCPGDNRTSAVLYGPCVPSVLEVDHRCPADSRRDHEWTQENQCQEEAPQETNYLKMLDQKSMFINQPRALLNEAEDLYVRQGSKIDHLMKVLNLKRELNVSIETPISYVNGRADSCYIDQEENNVNMASIVKQNGPEGVISNPGRFSTLNDLHEKKDQAEIAGANCNSANVAVTDEDEYSTTVEKEHKGFSWLKEDPAYFVADAKCGAVYNDSLHSKSLCQDADSPKIDFTSLDIYGRRNLILSGCEGYGNESRKVILNKINKEGVNEVNKLYIEEQSGLVNEKKKHNVSCTDDVTTMNHSSLFSESARNINICHIQTANQQSSVALMSTSCLEEEETEPLQQQNPGGVFQIPCLFNQDDLVASQEHLPMLSITNSTPMTLSINYSVKEGVLQKSPSRKHNRSIPSKATADNLSYLRSPEISLTLSSPPKSSQSQSSLGASIVGFGRRKISKKFSSLKKRNADKYVFLKSSRKDPRHPNKLSAKNNCRLKGLLSPRWALSKFRSKGSLPYSGLKRMSSQHQWMKHTPLSPSKYKIGETGCENMPEIPYLSVSKIMDANPLSEIMDRDAGHVFPSKPQNVIMMTVHKTPSRDVVATFATSNDGRPKASSPKLCESCRHDQFLPRCKLSSSDGFNSKDIAECSGFTSGLFPQGQMEYYLQDHNLAYKARNSSILISPEKLSRLKALSPESIRDFDQNHLLDSASYLKRNFHETFLPFALEKDQEILLKKQESEYPSETLPIQKFMPQNDMHCSTVSNQENLKTSNQHLSSTFTACQLMLNNFISSHFLKPSNDKSFQMPETFQDLPPHGIEPIQINSPNINKQTNQGERNENERIASPPKISAMDIHRASEKCSNNTIKESPTGNVKNRVLVTATVSSKKPDHSPELSGKQDRSTQVSAKRDTSPQLYGKRDTSPQLSGKRNNSPELSGKRDNSPQLSGKRDNSPELSGNMDNSRQLSGKQDDRPQLFGQASYSEDLKLMTLSNDNYFSRKRSNSPVSVYPLPSILEEFINFDRYISGDLTSPEKKFLSTVHHLESYDSPELKNQKKIKCSDRQKSSQKRELLRRSPTGRDPKSKKEFCDKGEKKTIVKRSNGGKTSANVKKHQNSSARDVDKGKRYVVKAATKCGSSSACHDSSRSLTSSRDRCERKDVTEYHSIPADISEHFYDALENVATCSSHPGNSFHNKQNVHIKNGSEAEKPGIKFINKSSCRMADFDLSENKGGVVEIKKGDYNENVTGKIVTVPKNEHRIAFRFAPRGKMESELASIERTNKLDFGTKKRGYGRKSGESKNWETRPAGEDIQNYKLSFEGVSVDELERVEVSKFKRHRAHRQGQDDPRGNSDHNRMAINDDRADITLYNSLKSEKEDSLVNEFCCPGEDFYSIINK